jgi:hypothetical protein
VPAISFQWENSTRVSARLDLHTLLLLLFHSPLLVCFDMASVGPGNYVVVVLLVGVIKHQTNAPYVKLVLKREPYTVYLSFLPVLCCLTKS